MSAYYLIAQLPSLDGLGDGTPIPITEERFLELCQRFLVKRAWDEIQGMTLTPPIEPQVTHSALLEAWYSGERSLRLALAKVRAEQMGRPFDLTNQNLPAELLKTAREAVAVENPLEAENLLLQYRLRLLEAQRPMDGFSEEYVFYYGLKLKLLLRIRGFDVKRGEAAYQNIYDSIISGDRAEAKR